MAVPNPERELGRLGDLLARELPRVVVLLGASAWFRNQAFERVLARLPDDVDVRRIDGSDDTDGGELVDLRGAGLFGRGNWLVVRRGDGWLKRHAETLESALAGIGRGCGLLLEAQKLDRRTRLAKALGEVGALFEFRDLYAEPYDRTRSPLEAELVGWVVDAAKKRGLPITPEAAFLLVTVVGKEPAELCAEIERVRVAVGGSARRLGSDDLRAHLSAWFESTPFDFADAILAFDRRAAMRSLHAMFARGVRGRDGGSVDSGGVFPFVVSWLHQTLSNVHEGRRLLDEGVRADDVAGRVGVRTFVERFVGQVRDNPLARLRRGLALLLDAERELRQTGEDPELLLERFVARYFRSGAA
jgi:DNA polymerase III delta subunit